MCLRMIFIIRLVSCLVKWSMQVAASLLLDTWLQGQLPVTDNYV